MPRPACRHCNSVGIPAGGSADESTAFARMIAHEIRNLLTPIRAKAQIALESDPALEHMTGLTARFIEVADRIGTVTDAILERSEIASDTFDPAEAVREAVSLTGADRTAGGCRIKIADELSAAPPPFATSRVAVRHILVNLLLNAVAVSKNGITILVERSTWNTPANGSSVMVTVRDTGPGMPAGVLGAINDDAGVTDHPRCGSNSISIGVGLEVVRLLCEKIGATLRAENIPGGGASITVILPNRAARRATDRGGFSEPDAAAA